MKKLRTIILSAVGLLLILAPTAASAASGYTDVSGVITYDGNHVGKGVKVTVVCDGNTLTDKTNKTGTYLVQFTKQECPKGSNVTVTATYNGVTGSVTKKAKKETNELNIAIVNVNLPEFGVVAGVSAALISGGAFLVIRRRQLSAN